MSFQLGTGMIKHKISQTYEINTTQLYLTVRYSKHVFERMRTWNNTINQK